MRNYRAFEKAKFTLEFNDINSFHVKQQPLH